MRDDSSSRGMKFDPTVNLGHVLTFLGFMTTIAAAWINLDKRVTIVETTQRHQLNIDAAQDLRLRDELALIRASQERMEGKLDAYTQDRRVPR